jgi:iron complex transport system permease protein
MLDLPWARLLGAFLSGHMLYMAGSLTQVVTSNALASPATLGVNAIVVLFILLAQWISILFGLSMGLDWLALLFYMAPLFLLWFYFQTRTHQKEFFQNRDQQSMEGILLLGLCLNLFVGAVFAVLQFLFMALNWEFPTSIWYGSFYSSDQARLGLLLFVFVVTNLVLWKQTYPLRMMSIGRDFALGLGVNIPKVQNKVLLMVFTLTGIVTCFYGVFAFFGLVMPHIVRKSFRFGQDVKKELFWGPLIGATFMMLLDFSCYHWPLDGAELPVGMVSSVIGSLVFLIALVSQRKSKRRVLAKGN